jgi:hypothetical protein
MSHIVTLCPIGTLKGMTSQHALKSPWVKILSSVDLMGVMTSQLESVLLPASVSVTKKHCSD